MLNSIKYTKDLCYSKTPADNPTTKFKVVVAKEDSAASGHYWREEDIYCLQNVIDQKGPDVTLLDSSQINAAQQGKLPLISSLSKEATTLVVLPSLKISSLISLGQLYDDSFRVIFDKRKLYVEKDAKLVLEGLRNLTVALFDIPIPYYDVYKKTLQINNHIQPPTYIAMYMAQKSNLPPQNYYTRRKNTMR